MKMWWSEEERSRCGELGWSFFIYAVYLLILLYYKNYYLLKSYSIYIVILFAKKNKINYFLILKKIN